MNSGKPIAIPDANNEIAGLIETLIATERRLEELTAGEVDTVAGRDGRTFVLRRAQAELRFREAAKEVAILNALPAHISLLDPRGGIVSVNEGWRRFADENALHAPGHGVGLNYLEVCDRARGASSSEAQQVAAGIRAVLSGREKRFSLEYPCHSPTEQRWFLLTATPLANDPPNGVVVMHLNITARKLGEMAMARLAAVVESSQDAIIGNDLQSIVTSWNKGAEQIFGYTAAEMVGKSISQLNPLGRPDEPHFIVEKIRQGETVEHFETVRQTKDRTLIDISVAASPIKDAGGTIRGVSIVARDITQRRRIEEALRISQANMAAAQRIAHFGSWELDLTDTHGIDANALRWSDEMFRIAGFEPRSVAVTNELFFRLVPVEEHEAVRQAVATAIRERRSYSITHRLIRPDGAERVVEETAEILFHEKTGQPLKIIGTAHDITERQRAESALQASEARNRTTLQGVAAGVVVHDSDLRIIAFNPQALELYGITAEQLKARTALDPLSGRVHADGSPFPDADLPYRRAHATRLPVRDVILGFRRPQSGDFIWLLVNANPVLTSQGEVSEVIVTLMNVTGRIQAEQAVQRQQIELRALFDLMPALIWFKDTDNRILRVNQRVAVATGKSLADIEGKRSVDIYPQEAAKFFADDLEIMQSGTPKLGIVETLRDPQGKVTWMSTDKVPVHDEEGKVTGIIVMAQDITERTEAAVAKETLSRKTERRERMLTTMLSSLSDFAHAYDRNGRFLFANQPLLDLWGLTLDAVVGKNFLDIGYPPEQATRLERELQEVFTTQTSVTGELLYTSRAGVAGIYEYIFSPAFAADGTVDFVVGSTRDISERKRAEVALRESERNLRFLNDCTEASRSVDSAQEIMRVMSQMLGQHLCASRCAYADVAQDGEHFTIFHDYTDGCASTEGQYHLSLFGPQAVAVLHSGQTLVVNDVDTELAPGAGLETFNAIDIKAIICCPLMKGGTLRAMMAVHQTTPRRWKPGEIALFEEVVGRCSATIERRTGEENLRISEKRFKALFDQAAVGVAISEIATGRFVLVNQHFCDTAGRSRDTLEQLTFAAITHPEDIARDVESMQQLQAGTSRQFTREKRYLRPDHTEVWINVTVSAMWASGEPPDFYIAIVQDITARKQLEEQFRHAQKMEAIGTLAGGIAHDFNNVLAAIMGYTEMAKIESPRNSTVSEYLDAVLQGARRATDLVRQILTFSRQQELERKPLQLRQVVNEALLLLRATIPTTIEFDISLAANVPKVLADTSQVHQIVMNLCTNAAHAMKDRPGRLTVKLEKVQVDRELDASVPDLHDGVYTRLAVSDTGKGMDPATMSRIFEPFFTTKTTGEGTGLGLAVVHGIMRSHEGAVTVHSRPGEGTTFHLYFPEHVSVEATAVLRPATAAPWGSGERILYVDDEAPLIMMGRLVLERLGYTVATSSNATDALALVRARPEAFDLVITDQSMPGMTGTALAERIHALRPDLPIILTTGYSATLTLEGVRAIGIRRLLLKPLTVDALGSAIGKVLQEAKSL